MADFLEISERRSKPRVETKVKVRIGGRDGELETFAGNLSRNGVFLETRDIFAEPGEKLQMEILAPDRDHLIKVTGKVARVIGPNRLGKTTGMAVQFLKVEARQAWQFDRFIDQLLDGRGLGCRKHPRAKTQVVVELKTKSLARKVIADNLSNGGLFLKTTIEGFSLGDTLTVIIVHPSSKRKFMAEAEVVHLRAGQSKVRDDFVEGIGVQFVDLPANRREDLGTFLKGVLTFQRR